MNEHTTQNTAMSFIPLLLVFLVFYFLIIKPQQKKAKERQNIINNLKIGDKIELNSGIIGEILEIKEKDQNLIIITANETKLEIKRDSVVNKI